MAKTKRRKRRQRPGTQRPGASPGAFVVHPDALPTSVRVLEYTQERLDEREVAAREVARPAAGRHTWIDVTGLGDAQALTALGRTFDVHPLALEDVVHTDQRPKAEFYGRALFIVVRIPSAGERDSEQLSIYVTEDAVLTFQEGPTTVLEPVRERLRRGGPRIRGSRVDYLAYALVDAIVDAYRPDLEPLIESVIAIERELTDAPGGDVVTRLHVLRGQFMTRRRIVMPLREVIHGIMRDDAALLSEETRVFWRDCLDHVHQLVDDIETERDRVNGLVDVHISLTGHRLNEVMKVLTIIATIFIPLSFIAGLYGMNFDTRASAWNMPELAWPFGYPLVLGVMALVALGMLAWFRRRGWILTDARAPRPGGEEER